MYNCVICGQKASFLARGRIAPKKYRRLGVCTRHIKAFKSEYFEIRYLDDKGVAGEIYQAARPGAA